MPRRQQQQQHDGGGVQGVAPAFRRGPGRTHQPRRELQRAMRALRVRFTGRRSKRGIVYADADGDGCIDDGEIDGLVEFARTNLGLRIVAY